MCLDTNVSGGDCDIMGYPRSRHADKHTQRSISSEYNHPSYPERPSIFRDVNINNLLCHDLT